MSYLNRPEGEMDMMIGFFLMNGFCVAHVSRAIRLGALKSMKKASEGIDCIVEEKQLDDETSQQCVVEKRNSDEVENQVHLPKLSLQSDENFRVLRSVQIEETHANTSSIVRQNLLGPLSFDDLHYT
ncbi:hypothetical protein DICVIV_00145 [Dictyocaulus viviparus]|uniref:Uncharacterized protein n=1 Tax=Dictyocaulus viviparus TaxID=29172 RepID=A0A0D8YGB4_DICVI|nr:hypothetical protein DICVIV_00145 [Dictyocaulus viviparus]